MSDGTEQTTAAVAETPATNASSPLLLSVVQAARLLGISRNLAYELVHQGRIPHVRLGRRVLVPRDELVDWIERESEGSPVALPVVSSAPE